MCSVAGEMLAAYSPPSYYFPLRMYPGGGRGGGRRAASPRHRLPRRPCIVLTPTEETKTKKKVVFADDRGLSLTQVRLMSEPSNLPPSWSSQFINLLTKDAEENCSEPWETAFVQPASDYIEFKKRLDECNVSLENVFVKDSEEVAIGTVKVRNLSFEKEVFIRVTYDEWATFKDMKCTYVNNSLSSSSVTVLYDTFSFRIPLTEHTSKVQFCVCFRSRGEEFWDNNTQQNYSLVRKMSGTIVTHLSKSEPVVIPKKEIEKDPWTQYTNWIDTPYW